MECCCCVTRLSSGVCIRARACVAECGTGSVAAGVKVAWAVNSLIPSHFLSRSFIFPFLWFGFTRLHPPHLHPDILHTHSHRHNLGPLPIMCERLVSDLLFNLCEFRIFWTEPEPSPVGARQGWRESFASDLRCGVHAFAGGGEFKTYVCIFTQMDSSLNAQRKQLSNLWSN